MLFRSVDKPVAVPGATVRAAGPSEVEARVADATSKTRAEKLVVPKE